MLFPRLKITVFSLLWVSIATLGYGSDSEKEESLIIEPKPEVSIKVEQPKNKSDSVMEMEKIAKSEFFSKKDMRRKILEEDMKMDYLELKYYRCTGCCWRVTENILEVVGVVAATAVTGLSSAAATGVIPSNVSTALNITVAILGGVGATIGALKLFAAKAGKSREEAEERFEQEMVKQVEEAEKLV